MLVGEGVSLSLFWCRDVASRLYLDLLGSVRLQIPGDIDTDIKIDNLSTFLLTFLPYRS